MPIRAGGRPAGTRVQGAAGTRNETQRRAGKGTKKAQQKLDAIQKNEGVSGGKVGKWESGKVRRGEG